MSPAMKGKCSYLSYAFSSFSYPFRILLSNCFVLLKNRNSFFNISELLILRDSWRSTSLWILKRASFSSLSFCSFSFLPRTCFSLIICRCDSSISSFVSLLPKFIFLPTLSMFSFLLPTYDLDSLYLGDIITFLSSPYGFGLEKW